MNPGVDPLDPLELALLLEAARTWPTSTATTRRRARRMVARTMRSREMPMPRRYKVAGPRATIQVADQAARLWPRWSLGAYCGPRRDNMLSFWSAGWSGADHAQ
jgi:hypothetical protein